MSATRPRAIQGWKPGRVTTSRTRQRPSAHDFERAMQALREIHEMRKKAEAEAAPRREQS